MNKVKLIFIASALFFSIFIGCTTVTYHNKVITQEIKMASIMIVIRDKDIIMSKGSGVFISKDTILSADHVVNVKAGYTYELIDSNGNTLNYTIINIIRNTTNDLAVIKLKANHEYFLEIAEKLPNWGDEIKNYGHTNSYKPLIFKGFFIDSNEHSILTTSRIYPGMSGGALLNSNNKIIGIVSRIKGIKIFDSIQAEASIFSNVVEYKEFLNEYRSL